MKGGSIYHTGYVLISKITEFSITGLKILGLVCTPIFFDRNTSYSAYIFEKTFKKNPG